MSDLSLALGTNLEGLTLTAEPGAINAIGNAQADALTGDAAANWLVGPDGNDTLHGGSNPLNQSDMPLGGAGDDTYKVDFALDFVDKGNTPGLAGFFWGLFIGRRSAGDRRGRHRSGRRGDHGSRRNYCTDTDGRFTPLLSCATLGEWPRKYASSLMLVIAPDWR